MTFEGMNIDQIREYLKEDLNLDWWVVDDIINSINLISETEYKAGKNHGYEDGMEQSYDDGKEDGYNEGFADGEESSSVKYDDIYDEGYEDGKAIGYERGFANGYESRAMND